MTTNLEPILRIVNWMRASGWTNEDRLWHWIQRDRDLSVTEIETLKQLDKDQQCKS